MSTDTVKLTVNGKTVLTAKDYDIQIAYFTTPNVFALTVGSAKTSVDLMREVPPNSEFEIAINDVPQFRGYTDGFERVGGGATELTIQGRDPMAQLLRNKLEADKTFSNATYEDLTIAAIEGAGVVDWALFAGDPVAQRRAVMGIPQIEKVRVSRKVQRGSDGAQKVELETRIISTGERSQEAFAIEGSTAESIKRMGALAQLSMQLGGADVVGVRMGVTTVESVLVSEVNRIKGYKAEKPVKWDAGTSYFEALKKELDRAGLFLRAGVDPGGSKTNVFTLATPNGRQYPVFGLVNSRREHLPDNVVNVLPPQIRYSFTGRHSDYIVLGQAGTAKDGRRPIVGRYHDAEVAAYGITAKLVVKDNECKTVTQANYRAQKLCAEERRANRSFVYTVANRHSFPTLADPKVRGIPTPDIVVYVVDVEHSIEAPFWVERVRFRSGPGGTTTELTLIPPDDLVFGDGIFYDPKALEGRIMMGQSV